MTANFRKPCCRPTLAAVSIAALMVIGLAGARGADSTNSPTSSASPNNPAPRLAVELRDGSRVVGTCPDAIWLFHSPLLGDLKVSVSQICSIEFASDSDTARLTATNGDAFNVQFTVAALNVEASFGKTELPVKLVESIKVSARGSGRLHSGLVALWSGEGNANDSVGGHNGVLQGGASYVSGKVEQAFSFNGVDACVDLGGWFDLQTFSVGLWVKPNAAQNEYANLIDDFGTDADSWNLQYDNTGLEFHFGIADGGRTADQFTLTPNTWQYVVLTRDGNNVSNFYLNGKLIDTHPGPGPINYNGSQFLRLGRWGGGGRFFRGQEEEVEIYNRALSAEEIQEIYTEQK